MFGKVVRQFSFLLLLIRDTLKPSQNTFGTALILGNNPNELSKQKLSQLLTCFLQIRFLTNLYLTSLSFNGRRRRQANPHECSKENW